MPVSPVAPPATAGTNLDPWLILLLLGALVLTVTGVFVAGVVLGARRRPSARISTGQGAPPVEHPDVSAVQEPPWDAWALAEGLFATYDAAQDHAERQRMQALLHRAGVVPVAARPGEPFDDRWHHAVARRVGPPDLAGVVVGELVRIGWRADSALIRPAEVEVLVPEGGQR